MESSTTRPEGQRLVIRPVLWSILPGWTIALFGLIFALAGFSEQGDTSALVAMAACGLLYAYLGISLATASATVTSQGIRYRCGALLRKVAVEDVASVEVGPGRGFGYSRIALVVNRRSGKAVVLTALQRADTAKGWREFSERAAQVAAILDLG